MIVALINTVLSFPSISILVVYKMHFQEVFLGVPKSVAYDFLLSCPATVFELLPQ